MFSSMSKIRAFLPAAAYYAVITFLSSRTNVRLPLVFPGIDKALHVLLYIGFGACLTWGFVRLDPGGERTRPGFVLPLGTLLSSLDEFHQMFVPGRTADWADLAADVLGVLAGWAILRAVLRRRAARRRRESPDAAPQP